MDFHKFLDEQYEFTIQELAGDFCLLVSKRGIFLPVISDYEPRQIMDGIDDLANPIFSLSTYELIKSLQ